MKLFIISLAVLSFFALDSEAFYRKCFPVTPPEPTTTPPPTTTVTTTTEPTTTTESTTVQTTTVTDPPTTTTEPTTTTTDPPTTTPVPTTTPPTTTTEPTTTSTPTTPTPTTTTTITTTTLSLPTTTPSAPTYACALWARYNNDIEPIDLGFFAGIARDGSDAYVGRGMWTDRMIPGRVKVGTGTIVPWGIEQTVYDPEYLIVPSGCTCTWMNPADTAGHPGIVQTPDQIYYYAIGRVQLGNGQIAISRVAMAPALQQWDQWYINAAGVEVCCTKATEVLVCETLTPPAGRPAITFKNEACGVWSNTNYPNLVNTHGFNAGNSLENTAAWVGRGSYAGQFMAGRYQYETANTLVSSGGDVAAFESEYLIVPQGCTCKWVDPNVAWVRRSAVHAPDQFWMDGIGYVNVGTNQVSISRINFHVDSDFTEWYSNTLLTTVTKTPAKHALICENIPEPSQNPCDLWNRYQLNAQPTVNGFSAGVSAYKNADNATAWVARGFRDSWLVPGRVQITGNTGAIYVTYGDEWITNPPWSTNGEGEYLIMRDGCTCKWMPPYLASNHPGLVRTEEQIVINNSWGPTDYVVGRWTYGDTRVSIGKVTTPFYYMKYTEGSTGVEKNTQYDPAPEVLVCESDQDMSTRPTVNLQPGEACGLWTKYRYNNWPATNGFSFGKDRFNNTAYVGRANSEDWLLIGRVQINSPAGIYVTNYGEPAGTVPEYLVVPNNCNCEWVAYNAAKTRNGLVHSIDYSYGFAVGRVSLGNGQYAVSIVYPRDGWQKWINAAGTLIVDYTPTEMLVCEVPTPPPPPACALWARYTNDADVINLGFKAGVARDGSDAYIGRGVWTDRIVPGRVKVGTGTIVPYGIEQTVYDPEYLVLQPGCGCSWMAPSAAINRPGMVQTPDQTYFYAIGRVQLGNGQIAISRVAISPSGEQFNQWYINAAGAEICCTKATEVLVCETSTTTAGRPAITFAGEACGVWSNTNYNNDVTTHGFSAGTSLNNTVAWVGRGTYASEFAAGRFEAANGITYIASGGDVAAFESEYLIVPQGCTCKWVDPNVAWIRRSAVHAPDDYYQFGVGRVAVGTNQVAISRINFHIDSDFTEWYAPTLTTWTSRVPAKEALICENIPDPNPNACDFWLRYNGDSSPTVNGFSAGISAFRNANNATAWVARGFRDSWLVPGRVQITGTAGAIYVTYGDEWITNPLWSTIGEGEYLVIRDGCTCSWKRPSLASNHPGLVRTCEQIVVNNAWGPTDYAIGRFTYGDTRVSIGKVTTPFYYMKYTTASTGVEVNTYPNPAPEVLVCESTTLASSKPTITWPSTYKACALWTRFRYNNWAATNGFSFGKDRFNNTAYVGRANSEDWILVGRVQLTAPMGIYVTNTGEPAGTVPEYLVVPNGCNCEWVAYALAKNRVGLVRSIDYSYGFAVGRVSLGNGQYAVSIVFPRDGWQKWINAAGILIVDYTPTEMLVCETP